MALTNRNPRGMHDHDPQVALNRQYICDTFNRLFRLHGFSPLDTPAMELAEVADGLYGGENDRLIFRILNSGDFLNRTDSLFEKAGPGGRPSSKELRPYISKKVLRYDLTVPFARYMSHAHSTLSFPFKRYTIQPVWRADRPQRGRYREFLQCDADIVCRGESIESQSNRLFFTQLFPLITDAFCNLNIQDISIYVNNISHIKDILKSLFKDADDKNINHILSILDKKDKIGIDAIIWQLDEAGYDSKAIDALYKLLHLKPIQTERPSLASDGKTLIFTYNNTLEHHREVYGEWFDEYAPEHKSKITSAIDFINTTNGIVYDNRISFKWDMTFSRGLHYYTGLIFEAKHSTYNGSLLGGGEYGNLISAFSKGETNLYGIGLSFGLDRIYDILSQGDLFPKNNNREIQVVIDIDQWKDAIWLSSYLRSQDIICEIAYDSKIPKCGNRQIPKFVIPYFCQKVNLGYICRPDEVNNRRPRYNAYTSYGIANFIKHHKHNA